MSLISYNKEFIFIHIYKCAGTSMKAALSEYCSPTFMEKILYTLGFSFLGLNRLGFVIPKRNFEGLVPQHPTAYEISQQISENIYNNFFKFAFVRNPWDLEVSLYHYMLQNEEHHQHQLIKLMKCFDEYIEWRVTSDLHSQAKYVLNPEGIKIVDFIGKFENLYSDFQEICSRLGIPNTLPHLNQSNHKKYIEYYNTHTKKLIADYFKQDIELFEYSFE